MQTAGKCEQDGPLLGRYGIITTTTWTLGRTYGAKMERWLKLTAKKSPNHSDLQITVTYRLVGYRITLPLTQFRFRHAFYSIYKFNESVRPFVCSHRDR